MFPDFNKFVLTICSSSKLFSKYPTVCLSSGGLRGPADLNGLQGRTNRALPTHSWTNDASCTDSSNR